MLQKFKLMLSVVKFWEIVFYFCIETLLRVGCVFVWNFCFSAEFNKFLFGTEKLGYLVGVIIVSIILFLTRNHTEVFNNLSTNNIERGV